MAMAQFYGSYWAMRAVTQDHVGATICGVRANWIHAATFAFGTGIVAIAAVVYTMLFPVDPYIGLSLTVKAFTIIILGGIGNLVGALAAGMKVLGPQFLVVTIVAGLLALPLLGSAYFTDYFFTLMIAYVLAQSWDWIGGEAGYINLSHYIFFGIGAYAFCLPLVAGVPVVLCFVIAFAVGLLSAVLLSVRLFRLRGDYFAFATLAMLPLFELLAHNFEFTKGADGVVLPPVYVLYEAYYVTIGIVVAAIILTAILSRIRFGYALKGIRNDEEAAEVCGIRIFPAKARVLALGANIPALARAVSGWKLSYIDPPTVFGMDVALVPVAMALLGGSGMLPLPEQNIHRALEFVQDAYVIENGWIVLEGSKETLLNDEGFSNKFLGLEQPEARQPDWVPRQLSTVPRRLAGTKRCWN